MKKSKKSSAASIKKADQGKTIAITTGSVIVYMITSVILVLPIVTTIRPEQSFYATMCAFHVGSFFTSIVGFIRWNDLDKKLKDETANLQDTYD